MQISKLKFVILMAAAFVLGGLVVVAFDKSAQPDSSQVDNKKIEAIQENIDEYYLNDYDEQELVENAYRGYVAGLGDPYSAYMSPTEFESWQASTTGDYSGIGMTFSEDNSGQFVVVEIAKDSPAEKAGLEPGDIILTVDGNTYTSSDVMAADIRGEAGTKVTLELIHKDEQIKKTITRDHIVQQSVDYKMLDGKVGYIEISQFIDSTADDFDAALKALSKDGATSLVLDLRDNGGGMVDQSVSVADEFLDEGPVCYVEDKNGKTESYDAEDGKTDLPTVVLVNENSASASEILAAAMHDNGYKLVGTKTFGKGVIQTTMTLSDKSALKLTIMQYLSPDKHKIHKKGIKPDYKVKDKENTKADEQLDKAIEIVKQ